MIEKLKKKTVTNDTDIKMLKINFWITTKKRIEHTILWRIFIPLLYALNSIWVWLIAMTWNCRVCVWIYIFFSIDLTELIHLGQSTQRRHNLWIIYDQLFIITYFFLYIQREK